jgi:NAD(P)-dependent dehydrogenase (short-subunit alcohol dehydrogenase family)
VLTLSPPLNLDPIWFRPAAYTASKHGMTIVTLGVAHTEREHGVAGNCLWPLTAIATAAVQNPLGGEETVGQSRTPQIVADAAGIVLRRNPTAYTGYRKIRQALGATAFAVNASTRPNSTASSTTTTPKTSSTSSTAGASAARSAARPAPSAKAGCSANPPPRARSQTPTTKKQC